MFKNTAAKFMVFAWDTTTGVAKTGDAANITAYVSKDYGAVTVLGDTSATEMDATNAKGYYLFDAAQAETNGDCLMVSAKSSTSNIAVIGAPAVIYTRPTTNWLAPATLNRTLVVDAAGLADANCVKLGPTGSGTAQTARDVGASVLLSTGTGAGQLDFTSGVVKANATQILGTAVSTPATAGILDVNVKNMNNVAATAITTIKAVQGLTTADTIATYTGNTPQTGDSYARIGAAGAGLTALGDTRIAHLDADVSSRGTSTLTQTQVTGGAYSVQSASCVLGDARIANLDATISSRLATSGYTAPDNTSVTAIKAKTDSLTFTIAGQVDANAESMNATQINGTGTSGDLWRGA